MSKEVEIISELFKTRFESTITSIEKLAQSGSYRQYFRIKSAGENTLGVYNTDLEENKAYLSFSKTFTEQGIKIPEIYAISEDSKSYLVEDIGTKALWDFAKEDITNKGVLSDKTTELYKKTLSELHKIQTKTISQLDLSYCYPRDAFDKQSILWDLNYFKYFFLRLMRVSVDEQGLEEDIQKLSTELDKEDQNYFLYRDFQSRNVLIKEETPYFIDFQGGRKGAIYYDLASLLYDANVELPENDRNILLEHYYQLIGKDSTIPKQEFLEKFYLFATVRLTQALGAFGLRGIIEKKPNFKECIPFALEALKDITSKLSLECKYPTLCKAIISAHKSNYIKESVAT